MIRSSTDPERRSDHQNVHLFEGYGWELVRSNPEYRVHLVDGVPSKPVPQTKLHCPA